METQIRQKLDLFPAYAGVIPANLDRGRSTKSFPRIRGAYQKTPRKVLCERLKKVPIKQTNRPGFRDGSRGGFVCRRRGQGQFFRPALSCISRKNAQTKSRQCRGKEEESDTACCIGTPEHCGLIRRDLVVCPPFWLLPRIETGDSFYGPAVRRCCGRTRREMCLHGFLRGEPFGGYGGYPFRSP